MKVTDLMIGDWVNYRPGWINEETGKVEWESHDEGFPVKIEFLYFCHGEGFVQYNDGENDGIEAADYELFPIPLTPEILEKNGFHYTNEHTLNGADTYILRLEQRGFYFKITIKLNDYFALDSYDDRVYRLVEISTGKWYVHHLQHALRLCGIEKR